MESRTKPGSRRWVADMEIQKLIREQRSAILEGYLEIKSRLSPKQWCAVALKYRRGLENSEIGAELGIGCKAVSALLKRAAAKRQYLDKQLRHEAFEIKKKLMDQEGDDVDS